MQTNQAVGTLQNVNGASVYLNDFGQYRNDGAIITGWSAASYVRKVEAAQQDAVRMHGDFMADIRKTVENADLMPKAKKRQTSEMAGTYLASVEASLSDIREAAQITLEIASRELKPAKPLKPEDAAQAVQDAEARTFLRSLGKQDRDAIVGRMRDGQHPGIAGAVLRADAILSGLSEESRRYLAVAGIAQNHPRSVISVGQFAIGLRDLAYALSSLGNSIVEASYEPGQELRGRVQNWHSAIMPAINELLEWLKPMPLELPSEQRLPEEVARRVAA